MVLVAKAHYGLHILDAVRLQNDIGRGGKTVALIFKSIGEGSMISSAGRSWENSVCRSIMFLEKRVEIEE